MALAALTAWRALTEHAHLAAGQHVLVNGGAGGVGSYAVQLATALGARVTATAAAGDAAFVASLGAHRVIDYARPPSGELADDVDVVVDTVGPATMSRSWRLLRPGGHAHWHRCSSIGPGSTAEKHHRTVREASTSSSSPADPA